MQDLREWSKPTKNGINVNFEVMQTKEDYQAEIGKVQGYIAEANKKFGTDWKVTFEPIEEVKH